MEQIAAAVYLARTIGTDGPVIPCGGQPRGEYQQKAVQMVGRDGATIAASFGCDCHGPVSGRANSQRTEVYLRAIHALTGIRVTGCPWRAFTSPLVARTGELYAYYEAGNIGAWLSGDDSERVWHALEMYIAISSRVKSKQFDEQHEKLKEKTHGK